MKQMEAMRTNLAVMEPPARTDRGYSQLIRLRASDREPALFCLHDGNFEEMASVMQGDYSVYGLRLVDPPLDLSVEQLAASHLQQVYKVQKRGPYQFIGYSFGGLVAFEMARLLANRGEEVGLLALVDTLNPSFRLTLSPAELKRFRRKYLVDRVKKYFRNLIEFRFDRIGASISLLLGKKIKPIAGRVAQKIARALGQPLKNIETAQVKSDMASSFVPRDFAGRVVLFRVEKALDGGSEFDDDPTLGWKEYAKKGVDIQMVAGGHATVVEMPYVRSLVDKLTPYLAPRDA